jgi:iron uptake system EfeUOB component EfeO/EfeM
MSWSLPLRAPALLVTALLAGPALAACGGGPSGPSVEVTAGDSSCAVAKTSLAPGKTTFAVHNDGSKVTEVYVYAKSGSGFTKTVEEAENIGPGTSRDLTVDLSAGTYEVACKPGMTGDGIRTRITVAG